ncbi:RNA polymerase sigma-70 factor [Flavobacterium hauense]
MKNEIGRGENFNALSDSDLLVLLRQDSVTAFEALYVRYKNRLQSFCLFMLKSPTVAQDVVQEVFIKVWSARRTLNTDQSFSNYIYTLAKNQSLNELRSAKRKETMENILIRQEEASENENAETKLIVKEYQALLEAAINELSEQKRRIYVMSRNEGKSHKEIAEIMQISPHTVQSHISDSLRVISDYFFRHADIEFYVVFMVLSMHS